MKFSPPKGFTLIEVLIAATILFTVIAVVSQSYRNATTASEKASRSVELVGVVPLLLDTIRFRLRQADVSQSIDQEGVLNGFVFSWQARVIKTGAPPDRLDPEDGGTVSFDDKFYLWQVDLSVSKQQYIQQFSFNELTWASQ